METLQEKIEKLRGQLISIKNDYKSLMDEASQKMEFKKCFYYQDRLITIVNILELVDKLVSNDIINTTIPEKI